jgi:hypothetical protein
LIIESRRLAIRHPDLCGPFVEQCFEYVGMVIDEEFAKSTEQGMAVSNLRRASTVPLERLGGGRRHRRPVAFDDGYVVTTSCQKQRRAQPRDSTTDDHNVAHAA